MANPEVSWGSGDPLEGFDSISEIKKMAAESREKVEQEFSATTNTWLECFLTRLSFIPLIIDMEPLPSYLKKIAEQRYMALLERVRILEKTYPTRESVPPASIQDELFSALDVIKQQSS